MARSGTSKTSRSLARGAGIAALALAAAGLGFALDGLVPPPGWSQPALVGPSPAEQFAAQAAGFLGAFDMVARLPLMEQLEIIRALGDQPDALPPQRSDKATPGEEPSAPKMDETPKTWTPQDIHAFWHSLPPDERVILGVLVEPRDGLRVPEALWPIEPAWEAYRLRPIEDRLNLLLNLEKFYWFLPHQRKRLLDNYQRLQRMEPSERQRLDDRLARFLDQPYEVQARLIGVFKRYRSQSPDEQARLRDLVRRVAR